MNNQSFLLTFEWDSKNEILEIHSDTLGLEKLVSKLTQLLKAKENDHMHLMTSNWGGKELTDEKQCDLNVLINHVKIYKWK